ncbi:hypothetical protein HN51_030763 [Arachis hypogaea]|uniref:Uncharacterized protein n=2 Tax=Arachis TaxID=3817 RepID=A0A445BA24_ARAHY|nr:cation/H(+) antiporter 4-like [Arachis duranensis]XP_025625122.1 cation/H(+) antiporter 4-like [Arachis hypogaea]RYR35499.1 hypothetical protein Ahy_A10g050645 [Arachis hypogaea]
MAEFAKENLFDNVKQLDNNTYRVCFKAPPRIVSDGIWGGQKNGRKPMKSFLPLFELQVLIIFVVTQICHFFFKRLRLPFLVSQIMAGIIIGISIQEEPTRDLMAKLFPFGSHDVISTISSIGFVLFIFINGVEMDFSMITRTGKKAWTLATIGLVLPTMIGYPLLQYILTKKPDLNSMRTDLMVSSALHNLVSFAVIYKTLNGLQMQNSELGRLALSTALSSDILSTTMACVIKAAMANGTKAKMLNSFYLIAFVTLIPLVFRPIMFWVIKNTPEGRPVSNGVVYLIILMVFGLGWISININQDFLLGAFILGLAVPEGPPLGSTLVKKLRFFGNWFFLPIFVATCTMKANFSFNHRPNVVIATSLVALLTHVVKTLAIFLPALWCKLPVSDALSLALILNSKGEMEVGLSSSQFDNKMIGGHTYGTMMISIMVTASIVQWSVKSLYDPSRKYAGYQKRNLMDMKPDSELRVLTCIHKKSHIVPITNVIDLFFPSLENPMTVDVLHLIELVGRSLPVFVSHRHQRVKSSHKAYSDDVIIAFDVYEHDNAGAVIVNTYTSISLPTLMHEDVCNLALDKVASMVILPFHQRWSIDGAIECDDKNMRALNKKVLDIAPCTVGILVSRGQHSIKESHTRLAVIYLGGTDDGEALCIARRAIKNPRVRLVVYRLVHKHYTPHCNDDLEDFMVTCNAIGNVCCTDVTVEEGSKTACFLRDIVNEHDLFIVGRRHELELPQLEGLTSWSEFLELGVIGDFLASPDFGSRASILVVQQQVSKT